MFTNVVALRLSASGFFGFGVWALFAPESMFAFRDTPLAAAPGRVDVRAFYGGLELGLALFFWLSSRRAAYERPALLAAALAFSGCVSARLAAMAWEASLTWPLGLAAAGELAGAILTISVYRANRPEAAA